MSRSLIINFIWAGCRRYRRLLEARRSIFVPRLNLNEDKRNDERLEKHLQRATPAPFLEGLLNGLPFARAIKFLVFKTSTRAPRNTSQGRRSVNNSSICKINRMCIQRLEYRRISVGKEFQLAIN